MLQQLEIFSYYSFFALVKIDDNHILKEAILFMMVKINTTVLNKFLKHIIDIFTTINPVEITK